MASFLWSKNVVYGNIWSICFIQDQEIFTGELDGKSVPNRARVWQHEERVEISSNEKSLKFRQISTNERGGPGYWAGLRIKRSGFEPGYSRPASLLPRVQKGTGEFNARG